MNKSTVVFGTKEQAGDASHGAIGFTQRVEAVLEMVSHGDVDRVIVCPNDLGCEQVEILSRFIAAYYPQCEVEVVGQIRSPVEAKQPVQTDGLQAIVLCSVKGGSGCTTIASNLAATLGSVSDSVALLDFSQPVGDVHLHFDVEPRTSVVDCLPFADDLQPEQVESKLIDCLGVRILCGIAGSRMGELLHAEQCWNIVSATHRLVRPVIIDVGCQYDLAMCLAQNDADVLPVVVVCPDVSSLSRLQTFCEEYECHPAVVLNNWTEQSDVTNSDVMRFARGCSLIGKVPRWDQVSKSIVDGRPLAVSEPKACFSSSVRQIASHLFPGVHSWNDESRPSNLFTRLWGAVTK